MGRPDWHRRPEYDQFFGGNPVFQHEDTGEFVVDRGVPDDLKPALREAIVNCVAMHNDLARFPTLRLRAVKREIEELFASHLRPAPRFDVWIDPLKPGMVQVRIEEW